jgi:hypothetical protein
MNNLKAVILPYGGLVLENDGCTMIFNRDNNGLQPMKELINRVSPFDSDGVSEFDYDQIDEDTQYKMIAYVDVCDEVNEK